MWFKGQKIEGDFNYILKQDVETGDFSRSLKDDTMSSNNSQQGVLDVFANILEQTEKSVTIERFNNYGRHQLPTVVKPLWEFQKDYRLITTEEKRKTVRSCDYEW